MIKHVIFDLGNVLVNIHPQKTMQEFANRCGFSTEKINSFYLSDLHLGFMAGEYLPDEFYNNMMDRFTCNISQEEFNEIWNRVIGEPKEGIAYLVNQLKSNYDLSVCSNTDPWHWEVARKKCRFINDFQNYFLSFEMKPNKPDLKIFKAILDKLPATGNECVFIDDLKENIEAASTFGIKGILASESEQMRAGLRELGLL